MSNNLPKATQLVSGRARTRTKDYLSPGSLLFPLYIARCYNHDQNSASGQRMLGPGHLQFLQVKSSNWRHPLIMVWRPLLPSWRMGGRQGANPSCTDGAGPCRKELCFILARWIELCCMLIFCPHSPFHHTAGPPSLRLHCPPVLC